MESLEAVGVSGTSDENRPLYHVYKSFATWEKRPLFIRMSRECGRLSLDRCGIKMKNTDQSQIIAQYHVVTIYFEWSNVEGWQRIFGACVAWISSFLWVHPLWDANVLLHTFLLLHADIWFLSNSLLYSAIFSSHAKGPWITKRSQPHKSEDEPWKCR